MDRVDRPGAEGPLVRTALDRLGNNDIQRLMSNLNQAETLAALVQKKKEETEKDMHGKIG